MENGQKRATNLFCYLRHNDVHLSAQFPQSVHQLFGIFVDSNPAAIHKDLGGTEAMKRSLGIIQNVWHNFEAEAEQTGQPPHHHHRRRPLVLRTISPDVPGV